MNAVKLQSFYLDLYDRQEDEPSYSWPPPNLAASELKRMMADGLRFVLILSGGGEDESWPDPSIGKSFRCSQGAHGTDLVHSQKVGLALRYVT
jgi:hypothetical protein